MGGGAETEIFLAVPVFEIVSAHFTGAGEVADLILAVVPAFEEAAGGHVHIVFIIFSGEGKIFCTDLSEGGVGLNLQII